MDAARAVAALAVLAAVALVALLRERARSRGPKAGTRLSAADVPGGLQAPLTVVYFTSPLCGACADVPALVAAAAPTLRAVAIDVRERPDLARALGVRETPTLLLVARDGRVRSVHESLPDADALAREAAGV